MSCCKETKYNLFLKLTNEQKQDQSFRRNLQENLIKALDYSNEQANLAVQWAVDNETFLISKDIVENVTKMSQKLALHNIPHQLKLSK